MPRTVERGKSVLNQANDAAASEMIKPKVLHPIPSQNEQAAIERVQSGKSSQLR
jgi:hypothetical protein